MVQNNTYLFTHSFVGQKCRMIWLKFPLETCEAEIKVLAICIPVWTTKFPPQPPKLLPVSRRTQFLVFEWLKFPFSCCLPAKGCPWLLKVMHILLLMDISVLKPQSALVILQISVISFSAMSQGKLLACEKQVIMFCPQDNLGWYLFLGKLISNLHNICKDLFVMWPVYEHDISLALQFQGLRVDNLRVQLLEFCLSHPA